MVNQRIIVIHFNVLTSGDISLCGDHHPRLPGVKKKDSKIKKKHMTIHARKTTHVINKQTYMEECQTIKNTTDKNTHPLGARPGGWLVIYGDTSERHARADERKGESRR